MAEPNGLELRREHLTVPEQPRLLRASQRLWDAVPRERRFDFGPPATPSPMTDTEILTARFDDPRIMESFALTKSNIYRHLDEHALDYDDITDEWIWASLEKGSHQGKDAKSSDYYYLYRALVEVATSEDVQPRLPGCLKIAAMVIDDLIMKPDDPERYLDPLVNGYTRGLAVVGTDVETGAMRVDTGGVDAIRFYFDI